MKQELTRAELEVMKILWQKGKAFVGDVLDCMSEPKPAYNTVSTVIRILERKGAVGHEAFGRSHRYFPLIDKGEYTRSYMRGVMHNFFEGSLPRMVSFFSEKENLTLAELDEIIAIANRIRSQKE
jgi:predicted transcriptional regulator